ncbi:MAG: hypothetical protein U0169_00955 [Polyangiaceae bacterium]
MRVRFVPAACPLVVLVLAFVACGARLGAERLIPSGGPPFPDVPSDASIAGDAAAALPIPDASAVGPGRDLATAWADAAGVPRDRMRVSVDTTAFASHPIGKKLGPLLGAAFALGPANAPDGIDLVRDARRVHAAFPRSTSRRPTLLAIRLEPHGAYDAAVRRVERKVPHGGPESGPFPGRVTSRRVRDRDGPRLLVRKDDDVLLVDPDSRSVAVATVGTFEDASSKDADGAAAFLRVDDPSAFANLPDLLPEGHTVRLDLDPRGGGTLTATLLCTDDDAAVRVSAILKDAVGWKNSLIVRLVTRSLLSGFDAVPQGRRVVATLPASDAQLSAAVNLIAGEMGVPPPIGFPGDGGRSEEK